MSTDIRSAVRDRYAALAKAARGAGCCDTAGGCGDPVTGKLYGADQAGDIPAAALAASLGCGNPTSLAQIEPGQTVLDLGSGGGIDVFLSGRRVGPVGKVYGLDMTDEMLELARKNQVKAGVTNVEFVKGTIEDIPLPDRSVDVIISNCVINLSADKDAVFREAFRVLRPGGTLAVSDVVTSGAVPDEVRRNVDCWVGCIAGALDRADYAARLTQAGFVDVSIEAWREYDEHFASAFIRARKPATACCGPSCCAA